MYIYTMTTKEVGEKKKWESRRKGAGGQRFRGLREQAIWMQRSCVSAVIVCDHIWACSWTIRYLGVVIFKLTGGA
jgi:hypothetical protein